MTASSFQTLLMSSSAEHSSSTEKSKSKDLSHVPCKFYKQGSCTAGTSCPFSHDLPGPGSSKPVCQWFAKGNCKFGHKCALAHILPGQPMSYDRKNKRAAQAALREQHAKEQSISQTYSSQSFSPTSQTLSFSPSSPSSFNTLSGYDAQHMNVPQLSSSLKLSSPAPLQTGVFEHRRINSNGSNFSPSGLSQSFSSAAHFSGPSGLSQSLSSREYANGRGPDYQGSPDYAGAKDYPFASPQQPDYVSQTLASSLSQSYSSTHDYPAAHGSPDPTPLTVHTRPSNLAQSLSNTEYMTTQFNNSPLGTSPFGSNFFNSVPAAAAAPSSALSSSISSSSDWLTNDNDASSDSEEQFLPSSLNDLLTPAEQKRRISRLTTSTTTSDFSPKSPGSLLQLSKVNIYGSVGQKPSAVASPPPQQFASLDDWGTTDSHSSSLLERLSALRLSEALSKHDSKIDKEKDLITPTSSMILPPRSTAHAPPSTNFVEYDEMQFDMET